MASIRDLPRHLAPLFAAVRAEVGEDFAVGCRFLGDEVIEGGSRVEDAATYGAAFARAGMDFLSVSKGGKFEDARQPKVGATIYSDEAGPFARNVPLAARIREAVRAGGFETPVVTAGGLCTFDQCEAILNAGHADIVAAARQSLADPDWWSKMRSGAGASIRRCKYTNYCEAKDARHQPVTCQLWDRVDGRRRLTAP